MGKLYAGLSQTLRHLPQSQPAHQPCPAQALTEGLFGRYSVHGYKNAYFSKSVNLYSKGDHS
jgi:hypothetical protein